MQLTVSIALEEPLVLPINYNHIVQSIIYRALGIMPDYVDFLHGCGSVSYTHLESGIKTGIRVASRNPRQVGADRIVDAAAVYELYGGPAIVVDYGTATTYDLVDENGTFTAVSYTHLDVYKRQG